ncbi:MAG: DUF2254 domain-containing protein [Rubricoccaceae bacterium]
MKTRLLATWDDLRSSYWFLPSLLAVSAIVLSFATTALDGIVGSDWIRSVGWLYENKPDGARTLLSTIAGSMIGVAGVTFSITIASVVYASGQYGPRLLTNFMYDRGNQITLGTFIATFLYCLLVLRTIRGADEGFGGENPAGDVVGPFVPHIAIATALALALASIGVLIYFIHHIPESIHVSNVIAGVGRDLRRKVDTLFPERIGRDEPTDAARQRDDVVTDLPDGFFEDAKPIQADGSGYIQGADGDRLLELACDENLVLRVLRRPGDFVAEGDALVLAWPELDDTTCQQIRRAFAWGRQRTSLQDVRFLIDELVEIAARALSPGINDPFTAMTCVDWLGGALKDLAGRDFPGSHRYGPDGRLRVVAQPTSYAEFVDRVFGQLRPYVAADRNAALHALRTIAEVSGRTEQEDQIDALRHQADAMNEGAQAVLQLEADRLAVAHRHQLVTRLLSGRMSYEEAMATSDWIGGTA